MGHAELFTPYKIIIRVTGLAGTPSQLLENPHDNAAVKRRNAKKTLERSENAHGTLMERLWNAWSLDPPLDKYSGFILIKFLRTCKRSTWYAVFLCRHERPQQKYRSLASGGLL